MAWVVADRIRPRRPATQEGGRGVLPVGPPHQRRWLLLLRHLQLRPPLRLLRHRRLRLPGISLIRLGVSLSGCLAAAEDAPPACCDTIRGLWVIRQPCWYAHPHNSTQLKFSTD